MRFLLAALLLFQETPKDDVVAIVGARILTVSKGELAKGVILIRNGKIVDVAADAKIPEGATIIDGKGLVAMPGLVNPYARILGGGGGSGQGSNPQVLAYDDFNPAADVLRQFPRTGYTTFAIYPNQGATSGQAVAVKPVGQSRESMVLEKSAYVRFSLELTTSSKQQLKTDFEAGRKAPAPPAKQDPRTEALGRFMRGDMPGIVEVDAASRIAHFYQLWKSFEPSKARWTLVVGPDSYKAVAPLAEHKASVVLRPELTFLPFTRSRVNPAAELAKAGVAVALLPANDSLAAHEQALFRLGELVKHGLDRNTALRAVTLQAAAVAGLEKRVGSLEPGKDADVLLFEGDPLDATSRLRLTLIDGKIRFDGRQP
jgi:imidazolonepropionase-like amidohydrolase